MTKNEQQIDLFYENVHDALKAAVQAAGGAKVVAGRLWPHKAGADSHRELLDALNRDRPRKLDPEETMMVLRLAREAGFHAAKHYIDEQTGSQKTPALDPRDELAELQRAYIESVALQRQIADRMERLSTPPIQLVKKQA